MLCACVRQEKISNSKEELSEGVDICATINLADFTLPAPDVESSTKALSPAELVAAREKLLNKDINSLIVALLRFDLGNVSNSTVIGYRVYVDELALGHDKKYLFKNEHDYRFRESSELLPDIPLSAGGGPHAGGDDDNTGGIHFDANGNGYYFVGEDTEADADIHGFNGFIKDPVTLKNVAAQVSWRFENPLHGKRERARAGTYMLVAVANFHESPSFCEGQTVAFWLKELMAYYNRHKEEESFKGVVFNPCPDPGADSSGDPEHPDGQFCGWQKIFRGRIMLTDANITHVAEPVPGVIFSDMNDTIESDSYIRDIRSEIMASMADLITVSHGEHRAHFTMPRLASVATFSVTNLSNFPLKISDFSLSDNFSAAAAYLFPSNPNLPGVFLSYAPNFLGAPVVTHEHALIPFDSNRSYASGVENETFFSGILMENMAENEDPLSYEIEVQMQGISIVKYLYDIATLPQVASDFNTALADDVSWSVGTSRSYLIRSYRTDILSGTGHQHFIRSYGSLNEPGGERFTGDNSNELARISGLINSVTQEEAYIWNFEKVSSTQFRIQSADDGYYLKVNGTNENGNDVLLLTNNSAEASIFTLAYNPGGNMPAGSENAVCFITSYASTPIYLHTLTWNQTPVKFRSISKWKDVGSHYYIYPVVPTNEEIPGSSLIKRVHVPVKVFTADNPLPSTLYALKRNQHLRTQIIVTYNEQSQDLEFEVLDWHEEHNDISFH